jgi:hypothetical protein
MKFYAVSLVRALLPCLRHRLARVRIASLDTMRLVVKVPNRDKRKGAGVTTSPLYTYVHTMHKNRIGASLMNTATDNRWAMCDRLDRIGSSLMWTPA